MDCPRINCVAFTRSAFGFAAGFLAQLIEQYLLSEGRSHQFSHLNFLIGHARAPSRRSPCAAIRFGRMAWCEIRVRFKEQRWELPRLQVSEMCRLEKPIYPGLRPELEKRSRRRMTKIARLCAHASQQIINLQGFNDVAEAACDAVVHSLSPGLWRFIGIKSENNRIVNSERSIADQSV